MSARKLLWLAIVVVVIVGAVWYRRSQPAPPAIPLGTALEIKAPVGLPPVPIPADNPPTAETIVLGRKLYYDPLLSVDNTVSCASCHAPYLGFSDGKPVSEGVNGQTGTRNAPTVINAAYLTTQFWDGRAPSLEKQAEGPVQNPVEMANTLEAVEKKLTADPTYRAAFKAAFGRDRISYEMVEKAIASFERTVLAGNSPFDRYFYQGDNTALSESAKRGLEVFRNPDQGNCAACHTIGKNYALFTDNKFHNLGVGVTTGVTGEAVLSDLGRYEVTQNEADQGAFKTPTLRNIAHTAPYMHDGSLKTLKDVIDFYIGGGNSNPYLDPEIHALDFLSGQERDDLLAFLESLTGEFPYEVGPPGKVKKQASGESRGE
ncbi:MAG: cytochrome-c peroxidase [Terriglobia bacterium]